MAKYWEDVGPPVHVTAAAYVGWGKKPDTKGPQAKTVDPKIGEDPALLWQQWKHTGGMIQ